MNNEGKHIYSSHVYCLLFIIVILHAKLARFKHIQET